VWAVLPDALYQTRLSARLSHAAETGERVANRGSGAGGGSPTVQSPGEAQRTSRGQEKRVLSYQWGRLHPSTLLYVAPAWRRLRICGRSGSQGWFPPPAIRNACFLPGMNARVSAGGGLMKRTMACHRVLRPTAGHGSSF